MRTVCALAMFASVVFAQSASTGALTGTVTDSSGAVIPGVTVTATNQGTGQERSDTTNAEGLTDSGCCRRGLTN